MKFIFGFFLICCFAEYTKAQTETHLPVDERGKLIYYEVVELKNTPKDSLKNRTISYLKDENKLIKLKSVKLDSIIYATGKFSIDKTVLVVSHPSGEILYNFHIEIKEDKYRFWLSDFNFIPYQRDRYGNFVAVTTIGTPLESDPGKLNAAQWKDYQSQTAKYAISFAAKFKEYMAGEKPAVTVVAREKKTISKNW